MKIINYKVISATYPSGLEIQVRESIKQGWQPFGGVTYGESYSPAGSRYYEWGQAVVKYEKIIIDDNPESTAEGAIKAMGVWMDLEKENGLTKWNG